MSAVGRLLIAACVAAVAGGCLAQPPVTQARPVVLGVRAGAQPPPAVLLGASQEVAVASAFGPGRGDVTARLTVFEVRDHVAAGVRPRAAGSHWASADVRVCRTAPVVLGFPAWVLGDDDGRTAQVAKVVHPTFPQPALKAGAGLGSCMRGWVTFVTPDDLHPTKVTFEQTREVPPPWRIAPAGGGR